MLEERREERRERKKEKGEETEEGVNGEGGGKELYLKILTWKAEEELRNLTEGGVRPIYLR